MRTDGNMGVEMERFGVSHVDGADAAQGLSCMVVGSHLPLKEGDEPGRFHLLEYGFYLSLLPGYLLFFPGRQRHGGTAAVAAPGTTAPEWAYRLVVIAYPPRRMVTGDSRRTICAIPGAAGAMYMGPEWTGAQ